MFDISTICPGCAHSVPITLEVSGVETNGAVVTASGTCPACGHTLLSVGTIPAPQEVTLLAAATGDNNTLVQQNIGNVIGPVIAELKGSNLTFTFGQPGETT